MKSWDDLKETAGLGKSVDSDDSIDGVLPPVDDDGANKSKTPRAVSSASKPVKKTEKAKEGNEKRSSGSSAKGIHDGHRERMRRRHELDPDMTTFAPHEALEYLLFNSVYRRNTNNIAHDLIARFGSLANVFDASFDSLRRAGLSESSISQIKQVLPLANMYNLEKHERARALGSSYDIADHFHTFFMNKSTECVYAALLNAGNKPITTINVGKGDNTSVQIDVFGLLSAAKDKHAVKVVLMHNHPGGIMIPSKADLISTGNIMVQLASVSSMLTDHIIFGPNGSYFSFYQNGLVDMLVERCRLFLGINVRSPSERSGDRVSYVGSGKLLSYESVSALEDKINASEDFIVDMDEVVERLNADPVISKVRD